MMMHRCIGLFFRRWEIRARVQLSEVTPLRTQLNGKNIVYGSMHSHACTISVCPCAHTSLVHRSGPFHCMSHPFVSPHALCEPVCCLHNERNIFYGKMPSHARITSVRLCAHTSLIHRSGRYLCMSHTFISPHALCEPVRTLHAYL